MPVPRRGKEFNDEYTYTLDGKLVPKTADQHNPTYSPKAKKLTNEMIKKGEQSVKEMSSEIVTYTMSKEEIAKKFPK